MKQLIMALCVSLLASCAYSNQYGPCVGFFEKQDPRLEYTLSIRNAVWTALSPWTIVSPVVWFLTCAKCPSGFTEKPPKAMQSTRYRLAYTPVFSQQES